MSSSALRAAYACKLPGWATLVGLLLLLGVSACSSPPAPPPNLEELRKDVPLSETFDVTYEYTDSARLKARMRAPHLFERAEGKNKRVSIADQGIKIAFFNEQGQPKSHLRANRAEIHDAQGIARATGNVVVLNEDGDRMETELLIWYREEDQIRTPAFVKITTDEEIIYGDSLVSDTEFSSYTIYHIKGTVALKE